MQGIVILDSITVKDTMGESERNCNPMPIKEQTTIFCINEIHTIHAKMTAIAKADEPVPSWKPIATAKADTVAECDEGIPPESSNLLESHLFSLYLSI